MIRLVFDAPQALHRLHLVFSEVQHERAQEFVVQGSADGGQSFREIVRQQYQAGTILQGARVSCTSD
jgi:hypothetical protein